MAELELTVACDFTDRTAPLFAGFITPDGIDPNMMHVEIEESSKRMAWHGEYDAAEISMSNYILARSQGREDMIAIPVFPSRFFRHSCVWVRTDVGIEEPADLKGKRVGIPTYPMTAALWMRGILADDFDIYPNDLHWFYGGEEQSGRKTTVPFSHPKGVDLTPIGDDKTLSAMFQRGELDAILSARTPSVADDDEIRPLFPNSKEVERDYYERTGFFPIMHTIVLNAETYKEHKWIARNLMTAFTRAKDFALEDIADTGELKASIPWLTQEVSETRDLMGEDYWPYGVEENRRMLEKMTQYSYDQGLSERKVDVDELFAEETYADPSKT